ncbi:unnamed protein product [Acanthocheilonema viteae]|uniref:Uncharacterized protein n=1 Tax=Acanthocheilonema viteae TaxID=6277 RepID=A0A498S3A7_ACAVI|nr:unnamed protein product [Acanthocheilonema viteae]
MVTGPCDGNSVIARFFMPPMFLGEVQEGLRVEVQVINLLHLRTTSEETRNLNIPSYFSIDFISARQPVVWITGHEVSLATAGLTLGMPKAFDLPAKKDEFLNYTNTHPDRLWVKKNNEHRGIRIQNIKELNLLDNDSFIQEYISHPFLFDNRKFDIGIYTVITSVLPLLVYIYEEDVLLRFCSKDYEPFDANDVDKYVVGDNYTPLWQMPPLKKYYVEQQMTFQHTFNAYLVELGKDLSLIWNRIKEIIAVQNKMLATEANFADKRPFFELSRFDFALDKDLNVYLMEAMSPNLSSGHFILNKLLYEQVIINALSLVGIASHLHGISPENPTAPNVSAEMAAKKNSNILRSAYEEHMSRRNMRLILPRTIHEPKRFSPLRGELDTLLILLFDNKCKHDKTWCF